MAFELGFDLVGFTTAEPVSEKHSARLRDWLASGHAGDMHYMGRNFDKRTNPRALLPNARSVICVGLNYRTTKNGKPGAFANYALYEDYHKFVKDRLYMLAVEIKERVSPDRFKFKVCVDTVPLAERAIAERAGLGFIGKNRMLINPRLGGQILLGELVSTLDLPADNPIKNKCDGCNHCVEACPTGALHIDGTLDASRCISYLSMEHKGDIDEQLAGKMDGQLFGCDRCMLACPFEKIAPIRHNSDIRYFPERCNITAEQVLHWDEKDFLKVLSDSPCDRAGLAGIKRNARIAMANRKHDEH
ncbi:Epoxyqueuosine reductase [Anaerohalosphaera lusitana]|uniref:Epoxyqueuosine reductase n=1 Tax=Anaerohalosphaera lusitana TaxID=1936003 RepID=A0A1U9NKZ2_9BACT|nr:tRNA epoxyqueuosine(34) reductase QueG [Anaerohalosphaera lusitana]AQT68612.1 Epoxyqueuosine reductase [Anaerohalosphaera lusitana]